MWGIREKNVATEERQGFPLPASGGKTVYVPARYEAPAGTIPQRAVTGQAEFTDLPDR